MDEILESMKDSDYAVYAVPNGNPYIISKAELKQMLTSSGKSVEEISQLLRPTCVISKDQLGFIMNTQDPLFWEKVQVAARKLQIVSRDESDFVLKKTR